NSLARHQRCAVFNRCVTAAGRVKHGTLLHRGRWFPTAAPQLFFLLTWQPPRSTLFPYTTLFRSAPPTSLRTCGIGPPDARSWCRSEEHTSELQSRGHLVCRLLPEKKKPAT